MLKKIETREERLRREKRRNLFVAIAMIVILMGSAFGIALSSFGTEVQPEVENYKGFDLTKIGNYYILTIQNIGFSFLIDPRTLPDLDVDVNLQKSLTEYVSEELFLYSTDPASTGEIKRNFGLFTTEMTEICTPEKCDESEINCEKNTIVIKESDENKIYEDGNCTYVVGDKNALLELTDEFILQSIGLGNK